MDVRGKEVGPPPNEVAKAVPLGDDIVAILETIDVPLIVVGSDCTVTRFNRAAGKALGLTASDSGRFLRTISGLSGEKNYERLCAQVIADGALCRCDVRIADRWFVLCIAPYTGNDGEVRGAVLTFTNVTGFRASIEQAIYEREYTKAILNTVEPLVVLNASLRVQTANKAFYDTFEVSREQTQDVPLDDLGNQAWKDLGFWPSLKAMFSEDGEFQTIEVERELAMGRRTLLLDARRLPRGREALVLVVLRDITKRKRAEEALREAKDQLARQAAELERVVEERTAKARRLEHDLEHVSRVSTLGVLAGSLAHELSQPLTSILSNAAAAHLFMNGEQNNGDKVRDALKDIREQGRRAREIIIGMRGMLKKDPGQIASQDLNLAVREVLELLRSNLASGHVTPVLRLDPLLPPVKGHGVQLRQVVLNLAMNACDAMSDVPADRRMLTIESRCVAADEVEVSVTDCGFGFPLEMLGHAFEPFHTTKAKGLGLGLAICNSIIAAHGGRLAASNNHDKGATVKFTLPAQSENGE